MDASNERSFTELLSTVLNHPTGEVSFEDFVETAFAITKAVYTGDESVTFKCRRFQETVVHHDGVYTDYQDNIKQYTVDRGLSASEVARNGEEGGIITERSLQTYDNQSTTVVHQIIRNASLFMSKDGNNTLANTFQRFGQSDEYNRGMLTFVNDLDFDTNWQESAVLAVHSQDNKIYASFCFGGPGCDGVARQLVFDTLEHIFNTVLSQWLIPICDLCLLAPSNFEFVRKTADPQIETLNASLDDILHEQLSVRSAAIAIDAWDGTLTYAQLHELSTKFASSLIRIGVQSGEQIPLCMNKSKWTIVAMFGILMVGATCVPLDIRAPKSRIVFLTERLAAHYAVSDTQNAPKFEDISLLVVRPDEQVAIVSHEIAKLPPVPTMSPAFVSFTSGSSGIPKGVIQQHGPLYTKLSYLSKACKLDNSSRVFQFAPYVSDASVSDIFATLMCGGCLCIPSEDQRVGDLAETLNTMKVTHAFLTNTMATFLRPEILDTLKHLFVGGEALKKSQVDRWREKLTFHAIYGTTESLLWDSISEDDDLSVACNNLGRSFGSSFWLVNPDNIEHLQPIGAVGEILIEGPLLAKGYLNDPETTSTKFISGPSWLKRLRQDESVRCYRTGDRAYFNGNGTLSFIGRTDTQIKLRGQRIEPGEIEGHIKELEISFSQTCVTILKPTGHAGQESLVAFVCDAQADASAADSGPFLPMSAHFRQKISRLRTVLTQSLPRYMVPPFFVPLKTMPLTVLGKLDRSAVSRLYSSLDSTTLAQYVAGGSSEIRLPNTENEQLLRNAWAEVLALPTATISTDNDFWSLGGDSVKAIQLAAYMREKSMAISMTQISQFPILTDMAVSMLNIKEDPGFMEISAFAMATCGPDLEAYIQRAADACQIPNGSVEDILPATAMQEALMAISVHRAGAYRGQIAFELPEHIELRRFQSAWQAVVDAQAILRTRIVVDQSKQAIQVVVRPSIINWQVCRTKLHDYLQEDKLKSMDYGDGLCRFAIVEDAQKRVLIWTVHHALYDGWSQSLLFEQIKSHYQKGTIPLAVPFSHFIKYIMSIDQGASDEFWRSQFTSSIASYPRLPFSNFDVCPSSAKSLVVPLPKRLKTALTLATVVEAAWAIVLSRQTNTSDVTYGLTLSGRDTPVAKITTMVAPTLTTVPVTVTINREQTVTSYLLETQQRTSQIKQHQHIGLQRIRHLSPEAKSATEFQNLLVIHPHPDDSLRTLCSDLNLRLCGPSHTEALDYALIVQCTIDDVSESLKLTMEYDERVLTHAVIESLLHQMNTLISRLLRGPSAALVQDLDCASERDIELFASWYAEPISAVEATLHGLFEEKARQTPSAQALSTAESFITYGELDAWATSLVPALQAVGVDTEVCVILCFHKSIWPIIAMLAVLKAGGICVSVIPENPTSRISEIYTDTRARVLLCDSSSAGRFEQTSLRTLIIDKSRLEQSIIRSTPEVREVLPTNAAFIVYSSGSTGKPKGSVLEHRSLCTSLIFNCSKTGMGSQSRALQFSAYTFDHHILEIFGPLILGGCVCVISEEERMNSLASTINSQRATWAILTPTVLRLLSPDSVPTLKNLIIGGEPLTLQISQTWASRLRCYNALGPSECTPLSCITNELAPSSSPSNIGFPIGCRIWITSYKQPHKLLSLGCIGEMVIQGPNVGREYVNRPEATAAAFIEDPPWAKKFPNTGARFYRSGDLARFNADGSVDFVGRADFQVKIHGQRVELGEIEHRILSIQPKLAFVAAHKLQLGNEDDSGVLAVFVNFHNSVESPKNILPGQRLLQINHEMHEILTYTRQELSKQLPAYMVPALYIPVAAMPKSASAKLDRKTLLTWVEGFESPEIQQFFINRKREVVPPNDAMQQLVMTLWCEVLKTQQGSLSIEDNFFEIGGDSVRAMQLSTLLRERGCQLTASQIFTYSTIRAMAKAIIHITPLSEVHSARPFSLLIADAVIDNIILEAASLTGLGVDAIENIYPATATQEALMAISARKGRAYQNQAAFTMPITSSFDENRFRAAWQTVVDSQAILRSRIVFLEHLGTMQVVQKPSEIKWKTALKLSEYLSLDKDLLMIYGTELLRLAIFKDIETSCLNFVLTIHHALYDGWSLSMMLQEVARIYQSCNMTPKSTTPYEEFVRYLGTTDENNADDFWRAQFSAGAQSYPHVPAHHVPEPRETKNRTITLTGKPDSMSTIATSIQAAWAMVEAYQAGTKEEAVFGLLLSGRDVPLAGISKLMGPTMTTVPIRLEIDYTQTIGWLLRKIQDLNLQISSYQHMGLQNIRRLSQGAKDAVDCQNLLVITPSTAIMSDLNSIGFENVDHEQKDFLDRALTIDCTMSTDRVQVMAHYDQEVISDIEIDYLLDQFSHILTQLVFTSHGTPLREMQILSPHDFQRLLAFNNKPLIEHRQTLHGLVEAQVLLRPEAIAMSTSCMDFTYQDLDDQATVLAQRLSRLGVNRGHKVVLCFAKSPWPIISMYAVLKAGGACVSVNKDHPKERLVDVCTDVDAKIVLCDADSIIKFSGLGVQVLVIDGTISEDLTVVNVDCLTSAILPTDDAFVVYTSGSTGKPKGCVLTHTSVSTSQQVNATVMHIDADTRVAQFAAFTFDASICEIFAPLVRGGCICVISDDERVNDLANAITRHKANWVMLTPSVAQLLRPIEVPTVTTLVFGGEPLTKQALENWCDEKVRLVNYWGPTECSNSGCVNTNVSINSNPLDIGHASGCYVWLAEKGDVNRLVPLGCVGELLVEGPMVSSGYLNRPGQSAKAFISDLTWSRQSGKSQPRRFFRTGDLARFRPDGTLTFIGREDTQVKLSGQRVELGEIEHQIRRAESCIESVVVELIKYPGRASNQSLTAFVSRKSYKKEKAASILAPEKVPSNLLETIQTKLASSLPRYMIPSIFLQVYSMPLTASQKLDRRALRSVALSLSTKELASYSKSENVEVQEPITEYELHLQSTWAQLLKLPQDQVGRNDHFFRLGGDSVVAMALVSSLRKRGLQTTVADIFQKPILQEMAQTLRVQEVEPENFDSISSFSLLPTGTDISTTVADAVRQCNVSSEEIEDIYPCTPLQEALMAVAVRRTGAYVQQQVWRLPQSIDTSRFTLAWDQVISSYPIFRSRIAFVQELGSLQVVQRSIDAWYKDTNLQAYLERDKKHAMAYGDCLNRRAIIEGECENIFVWTMHHAIYDGYLLSKTLLEAKRIYDGGTLSPAIPYSRFVSFIQNDQNDATAKEFWRDQFSSVAVGFPTLPSVDYQSYARQRSNTMFKISSRKGSSITLATTLQAAWALVSARYMDSSEALYGLNLSGRDTPLVGIGDVQGPTTATVPIRINLDNTQSVSRFLNAVQQQLAQIQRYQHFGLQKIRDLGPEARSATDFQTLILIQPGTAAEFNVTLNEWELRQIEIGENDFYTHPLVLDCTLYTDRIGIEAQFDETVISCANMQCLFNQFGHALALLQDERCDKMLHELDLVTPHDYRRLLDWNGKRLSCIETTIHELFQKQVIIGPNQTAIDGYDGKYTYAELDAVSERLSDILKRVGVGPEVRVAICFGKSKWPIVAMLATFKAGGTCVPCNPANPKQRLLEICEDAEVQLVLCDDGLARIFEGYVPEIIKLNDALVLNSSKSCPPEGTLDSLIQASSSDDETLSDHNSDHSNESPPRLSSLDGLNNSQGAAYVMFTSGTTGKPKGIVLEHQALCTSLINIGKASGMNGKTRSLQFTSYTFDFHMPEIWAVLMYGGCICVISDLERSGDLAQVITRRQVNWALLTPTVARLISPRSVSTLQTLLIGGEAPATQDYRQWAKHVRLLNAYGPTEASIISSMSQAAASTDQEPTNIGHSLSCHSWITDRHRPDRLVPIGTPGELLIEGPILARGYMKRPKATAKAFIINPKWVEKSEYPRRFYRTGDLAKFNLDGSITYLGRIDTQVKIHGQRVELGEIEDTVQRLLPKCHVAVELVNPADKVLNTILVCFIACEKTNLLLEDQPMQIFAGTNGIDFIDTSFTKTLSAKLGNTLPHYMIPSAYVQLSKLPATLHGKLDRTKLRALAVKVTSQDIVAQSAGFSDIKPLRTTSEIILAEFWSQVLNIQVDVIGANTSFLHIGGDSIGAMKLVATARKNGYQLTVGDVFMKPVLENMATTLAPLTHDEPEVGITPFSTIENVNVKVLLDEVVIPQVLCLRNEIENVLTLTDFQTVCVRSAVNGTRSRTVYFMCTLESATKSEIINQACQQLLNRHDALRTVFVQDGSRILQVVLRSVDVHAEGHITSEDTKKVAKTLATADLSTKFRYGCLWTKFWFISGKDGSKLLLLRLNHAQYDGTAVPTLFKDLECLLHASGGNLSPPSSFSSYYTIAATQRTAAGWKYWRQLLKDATVTQLPTVGKIAKNSQQVATIDSIYKLVPLPQWSKSFTLSDMLSAIFSLTVAQITEQTDVIFGQVMSGRNVPSLGVDRVVGACINTLPIRAQVDRHQPFSKLIQCIHDQKVALLPYETYQFSEIRRCLDMDVSPKEHASEGNLPWVIYHQNMPRVDTTSMRVEDYIPEVEMLIEDELSLITEVKGENLLLLVIGRRSRRRLLEEVIGKMERHLSAVRVKDNIVFIDPE